MSDDFRRLLSGVNLSTLQQELGNCVDHGSVDPDFLNRFRVEGNAAAACDYVVEEAKARANNSNEWTELTERARIATWNGNDNVFKALGKCANQEDFQGLPLNRSPEFYPLGNGDRSIFSGQNYCTAVTNGYNRAIEEGAVTQDSVPYHPSQPWGHQRPDYGWGRGGYDWRHRPGHRIYPLPRDNGNGF